MEVKAWAMSLKFSLAILGTLCALTLLASALHHTSVLILGAVLLPVVIHLGRRAVPRLLGRERRGRVRLAALRR